MLESRLINSVLPPVIVLFITWLSLCHMLVFNAFLTVHTTVCFFYVCVLVFLCVVCCVCQWSLVDWFSNKWMDGWIWLLIAGPLYCKCPFLLRLRVALLTQQPTHTYDYDATLSWVASYVWFGDIAHYRSSDVNRPWTRVFVRVCLCALSFALITMSLKLDLHHSFFSRHFVTE